MEGSKTKIENDEQNLYIQKCKILVTKCDGVEYDP